MKAHILLALISIMVSACASHQRDPASSQEDQTSPGLRENRQIFDGPGTRAR